MPEPPYCDGVSVTGRWSNSTVPFAICESVTCKSSFDTPTSNDAVDVSRWTEYGYDRLYINKLGSSWENFYVDLDGGEGHQTPGVHTDIEVDGDVVTVEWTRNNESTRRVVVDLDPSTDDGPVSEVPPEVPYNSRTAGTAQQINAQAAAEDN